MRLAPIVVAVVCLFAGARRGVAQSDGERIQLHKVSRGDSLELLAAEYYGDREQKIYIMIENGLDHRRELRNGERLRIPVSQDITTAEGDTLASLALTYLGDARRARFLAEFNGLGEEASLAAGLTLSIPLRVTYRARQPASLRAIALALFRDGGKADLLKAYNFLASDQLAVGDTIVIPIYQRVQPSKRRQPDAESAERVEKRIRITEDARRALPRARVAWQRGDYQTVKQVLTAVMPNFSYLDSELCAEVGVLLGSAYVAFDDPVTARATFLEVLARLPHYALSKYEHSPKVRAVWVQAGGAVE